MKLILPVTLCRRRKISWNGCTSWRGLHVIPAQPIVKMIYESSVKIMKSSAMANIEEGDVTLDQIRSMLASDFDKLHDKLDKILQEPLHSSRVLIDDALIKLKYGKVDEANKHFEQAKQKAIKAFALAPSFEGKLAASRIQLFCTLHLSGYYLNHGHYNKKELHDLCFRIFNDLVTKSPEVRSSIRDEVLQISSLFLRLDLPGAQQKRLKILSQVAEFKHFIEETLSSEDLCPIMDVSSGKAVHLFDAPLMVWTGHTQTVTQVSINTNTPRRLYSASEDQSIRIWDIEHGDCLMVLKNAHCRPVQNVVSVDKYVYSSDVQDPAIRVWDITAPATTTPPRPVMTLLGHTEPIANLFLHKRRLFSSGWDHTIRIWDLRCHHHTCTGILSQPTLSAVITMTIDEAGRRLYTGSFDGTLHVWDLDNMSCVQTLPGHALSIQNLFLHADRLYVGYYDGKIDVLDSQTLSKITTLSGHQDKILTMTILNGRLYSGSADLTLRIWDLDTWQCIRTVSANIHTIASSSSATAAAASAMSKVTLLPTSATTMLGWKQQQLEKKVDSSMVTSMIILGGRWIMGMRNGTIVMKLL